MPQIIKDKTVDEVSEEWEAKKENPEKESAVAEEGVYEAPDFTGADADIIMPEDLDPDMVLFEGGPTAGEIVNWKQHHKRVYITEISFDEYVIWRTINRGEYKNLVKTINQIMESGQVSEVELNMYNEEAICKLCVLFPILDNDAWDNQLAGMPSIISQQILEQSGFRPIDTRGL
jgi:hypothetical protein